MIQLSQGQVSGKGALYDFEQEGMECRHSSIGPVNVMMNYKRPKRDPAIGFNLAK